MNEIEKVNAYCFALIGICRSTGAEEMNIDQENVTYLNEPIGDWKITVRKKDKKDWLIWSNEHNGWWAPNERGYVKAREKAGRYTYERALEIVSGANRHNGDKPFEAMVKDEE